MDAFERSAEDELGCLGSDSDGEASHDAEAPAPPRHREWSDEEKALVVRECCWPGTRVGEVARRYGLSANPGERLARPCAAGQAHLAVFAGDGGRAGRAGGADLGRAQGRGRAERCRIQVRARFRRA